MFNVVCVWVGPKNRTEYGVEWVHKLHKGVSDNLDMPFKFWCLTDRPEFFDADHRVNAIGYKGQEEGYWVKPALFKMDFAGPVLYIDIDVIITGNITKLVEGLMKKNNMYMTRSPTNGWANSSIMYWNGTDKFAYIGDAFFDNTEYWKKRFHRAAQGNLGDQAYITFQYPQHGYIHDLSGIVWYQSGGTTYQDATNGDSGHNFLITTGPLQKPHRVEQIRARGDSDIADLIDNHWILNTDE